MKPKFAHKLVHRSISIIGLLCLGAIGGGCAFMVGLPMPFLLGSLLLTAGVSLWRGTSGGRNIRHDEKAFILPSSLRRSFIAVIGTLIGATVSQDIWSLLPVFWPAFAAMGVYIVLAYALGYLIFRRIAHYDKPTALCSAMPGGLIEAAAFGEAGGGNVAILTLQHFIRVICVVLIVPALFWLFSGEAVGSAAGQTFDSAPYDTVDVILLLAMSIIGQVIGHRLNLPGAAMMGPLMLSACLHGVGVVDTVSPDWLLYLAQLGTGVGLGTQFSGFDRKHLRLAVGAGALSAVSMGVLAGGFAALLSAVVPLRFETLFICYAPGGIAEMGLIALSLGVNPLAVAACHLLRIFLTVFLTSRILPHVKKETS